MMKSKQLLPLFLVAAGLNGCSNTPTYPDNGAYEKGMQLLATQAMLTPNAQGKIDPANAAVVVGIARNASPAVDKAVTGAIAQEEVLTTPMQELREMDAARWTEALKKLFASRTLKGCRMILAADGTATVVCADATNLPAPTAAPGN